MRYHQDMLKLARKTHSAVTELQQQEECLPLVDLLLESVDQVIMSTQYMYLHYVTVLLCMCTELVPIGYAQLQHTHRQGDLKQMTSLPTSF